MSSRGHGHRRSGSNALWTVPVIVAALIGGLAAASLVHVSLAVAVAVSVVVGAITVFAASRWPGPDRATLTGPGAVTQPGPVQPGPVPPELAAQPDPVDLARPHAPPRAQRSQGPPPVTPSDTVVQLLPASPGADAPWWDAAQGGPPAPSQAALRAPAPDLSTYLSATFIAQCPNCGAFRLDIRQAGNGWDFRCESCRYTWAWQPGTPWPPVRVAPRRRRELHP